MNDVSASAVTRGLLTSTRARILHAANELFAQQGFSRVSMRTVATAAGVTKPALYYHFKDKEALFEECLADFNEQMAVTMRSATSSAGDVSARVRAVAEALLAGSPFHPARIHDELAEHVSGGLRRRLRATFQTVVVGPVTELFVEAERSGALREGVSPAMATAALIGTCMAFLRPGDGEGWLPAPLGPERSAKPADVVTDLVLRGVGS